MRLLTAFLLLGTVQAQVFPKSDLPGRTCQSTTTEVCASDINSLWLRLNALAANCPGGTSSPAAPTCSITTSSGTEGTTVEITGANLCPVYSTTFGNAAAVFSIMSATQAVAIAPNNTGSVTVWIASPYGSPANCGTFTYQSPLAVPTITTPLAASPSSVASGKNSTLSWVVSGATSLSIEPGVGTVTGTSKVVAPLSTTGYTLTAMNAACGGVTGVTCPTSSTTVTVIPAPTCPTMNPAAGQVGDQVTLGGANLTGAAVSFGATPATPTANTGSSITVRVPVGAASGVVSVTTTGGTANCGTGSFTVLPAAIAISNVTAENVTTTEADIAWDVSPSSTGQVEYGTTTSYGSLSVYEPNPYAHHIQHLSSLAPGTTYHYRVHSTDGASASAYSGDYTFATTQVAATAATPTFSPAAGSYASAQSVTISTTTPDATIYYTTDGSTPTHGSSTYASPVSVSSSSTLRAIAAASGYLDSAVGSASYVIGSVSGIHVATNGNDNSGNGSQGSPYQTINKGIALASASAGQNVVVVHAGAYSPFTVTKSGTSSYPITVRTAGDGDVTISPALGTQAISVLANYVVIDGFKVAGGRTYFGLIGIGNGSTSTNGVTIRNCTLTGTATTVDGSSNDNGLNAYNSQGFTFENNTLSEFLEFGIHASSHSGAAQNIIRGNTVNHCGYGLWAKAGDDGSNIDIYGNATATTYLIENNTSTNSAGNGILWENGTTSTFTARGNTLSGNHWAGIWASDSVNDVIDGNTMTGNHACVWSTVTTGATISRNICHHNNITSAVARNNPGAAISVRSGASGNKVYNNTVYANGAADNSGGIETTVATIVRNNIAIGNQTFDIQTSGGTVDHNRSNLTAAIWVHPDSATYDFNLVTPNSNTVDAGVNVGLSYTGLAPDLGALESALVASPGRGTTTAPTYLCAGTSGTCINKTVTGGNGTDCSTAKGCAGVTGMVWGTGSRDEDLIANSYNVMTAGAHGDCSTDDTDHIRTANTTARQQGKALYFPVPSGGCYLVKGVSPGYPTNDQQAILMPTTAWVGAPGAWPTIKNWGTNSDQTDEGFHKLIGFQGSTTSIIISGLTLDGGATGSMTAGGTACPLPGDWYNEIIKIHDSANVTIRNNFIVNAPGAAIYQASWADQTSAGSSNVIIDNNSMIGAKYQSIVISGTGTQDKPGTVITNNIVRNVFGYGKALDGEPCASENCTEQVWNVEAAYNQFEQYPASTLPNTGGGCPWDGKVFSIYSNHNATGGNIFVHHNSPYSGTGGVYGYGDGFLDPSSVVPNGWQNVVVNGTNCASGTTSCF